MTNEDDQAAEHSRPSIRICKIEKNRTGSYGFHLTRTKWDPYPWIAGIDDGSIAQASGLKVGDCILEVNGEDVIGLRVGEIANKALSAFEHITMLLWNAGSDANCDTEVSYRIITIEIAFVYYTYFLLRVDFQKKGNPVQF